MSVQLPLKAKLDLLPALGSIWLAVLYALITALYNRRARSWYLHIGYAVLRKATRRLSVAQLQCVAVPCPHPPLILWLEWTELTK